MRAIYHKLAVYLSAVRFELTVLALPFAYLSMILAADGLPTGWQFMWITIAMVGARTLGMSANRLLDRQLDARNPRTASRELPSGAVTSTELELICFISVGVFLLSAAMLNILALILAVIMALALA